uniref:LIM zinc-binding domain-containing protein n=1 Tax=Heterorhabditis bacteriophora TaxID=37862 RepID=A0A1I7XK04_HETBA
MVAAGASAVQDELAQITSLKEKKGDFESSVKEASNIEKITKVEDQLLSSGKVKANMEKFVSGAALEGDSEEEEDSERDSNIIRENKKKKKKEDLHFEQVADIKNKWKAGGIETSELKEAAERKELEELKGGPSVKERFHERTDSEKEVVERQWDRSELDTAAAAEARKSFMEGHAFEGSTVEKSATDLSELKFNQLKGFKERFEKGEGDAEVQKTAVDVDVNLGGIKAAFENSEENMTPEERSAQKKKEIEAEFLRYKLARRAAAERAKQQEEEGEVPPAIDGDDVAADVESIKDRFDKGDAFKVQGIDGCKHEQRAELEALKTEAKNLKQRFEKGVEEGSDLADEKKRQMQEEFETLKKEREEAQKRLEEERAQEEAIDVEKEDINIKVDHASKMAAKWEKIQAKEAKKAEKGRMPDKKTATRFCMRPQPKCAICFTTVYRAEQFGCFGVLYHIKCFRCAICGQALRVEGVHRSKNGRLYCHVHFKQVEKNTTHPVNDNTITNLNSNLPTTWERSQA